MNFDDREMTMQELVECLADELPADRVEKTVEELIHKGMIETLWDENGNISYRLTAIGRVIGKTINDQHQYELEQHDGWLGDSWDDEGWDDQEI
jgi:predicted transcriptional regulator